MRALLDLLKRSTQPTFNCCVFRRNSNDGDGDAIAANDLQ